MPWTCPLLCFSWTMLIALGTASGEEDATCQTAECADIASIKRRQPINGACPKGPEPVLAIGNVIIDNIFNTAEIPINDKVIVDSKKIYIGGQGANAAQTMALLGLQVSWMSRVGADADGQTAKARFKSLGMDLSHLITVPDAVTSSAAIIVTSSGQRSILIHDDKALFVSATDAVEAVIKRLDAGNFKAVYTDGWQIDMALPVVRAAAARGIPIVADCEVLNEETRELAALATFLVAPKSIILALAGADDVSSAVLALTKTGVKGRVVVACDGGEGSWSAREGDVAVLHVPVVEGVQVRDTTGAGDSFHAGYMAAILRGLDLHDAAAFATRVAAAKCETPGSVVTPEALERFGTVSNFCS